MGHPSLQSAMTCTLHACATFDMQGISWAELAHSPLDFDKVLPEHAVFLSHVKDFSHSQHANVSDPKIIANNYCSLSQSHSVMLTNKFTIIKFTFKKEKKQFSLFFVSTIWWLDDLRSMEKITRENAFQWKKKKAADYNKFNLRLLLISFWTTGSWSFKNPKWFW